MERELSFLPFTSAVLVSNDGQYLYTAHNYLSAFDLSEPSDPTLTNISWLPHSAGVPTAWNLTMSNDGQTLFELSEFEFLLGVLAITTMWLADHPGLVSLTWHGYIIETSAAVLIGIVTAIVVLTALIYRLWIFIRGVPAGILWLRGEGRRRQGYLALSRGMVAVAAGDPDEARRQAGWANNLIEEPSLTLLLSAQSAQLNGDEDSAHKFFTKKSLIYSYFFSIINSFFILNNFFYTFF